MNWRISRRRFLISTAGVGISINGALSNGVAPKWVDRGSFGPFHCSATLPLAPLAPVFGEVATIERDLQRTLGLPPVASPIAVYLLANESSHKALIRQLYPSVPYRRALYVQRGQQAAVYTYFHDELPTDLRHECTHALLHANMAMVPLWLDEGIAEYFEPPAAVRALHNPHLSRVRWDLRFGWIKPIEDLEHKTELSHMGSAEYRSAWAWVHFMLHGPAPAHAELVRFIADIRRGEPPGRLSSRLRASVPDLDSAIARHFRQFRAK